MPVPYRLFFSSKFQRNIEEMLVSPMPNYVILLGFMIGWRCSRIIGWFYCRNYCTLLYSLAGLFSNINNSSGIALSDDIFLGGCD